MSLSINFTNTNTKENFQMIDASLKKVLKNLGSNEKAQLMQKKAEAIQNMLIILKTNGTTGNKDDDAVLSSIRNRVIKALNIQGGKLFSTTLKNTDNETDIYGTGVFFEKELEMIKLALSSGRITQNKVETVISNISGSQTGGISNIMNQILDQDVYAPLKEVLEKSGIIKQTSTGKAIHYTNKMVKIDVLGAGVNSVLNISKQYNLSAAAQEVFQDIYKYNFSLKTNLKGYASEVGSTDPFRIYVTVLNALGYKEDFIFKSFTRFLTCHINSIKMVGDHPEHQNYGNIVLKKMVGLYELIGYGIDPNDTVDFIILNNRSGELRVYSTAYLLNQLYNKKQSNLSFSSTSNFGFRSVSISTKVKNI